MAYATGQAPEQSKFEVASIRPAAPFSAEERAARNFSRRGLTLSGRRVSFVDVTAGELIRRAFMIEGFQLSGPAWLTQRRYDIQALLPNDNSRPQLPQMLQTLLRDRFGLVTHTEPRPIPVYRLVVRKGGVTMQEVGPPTEPVEVLPNEAVEGTGENEVRFVASASGLFRRVTALTVWETRPVAPQILELKATRITMKELADFLRTFAGRPVIDETGLTGLYQFTIQVPSTSIGTDALLRSGVTTTSTGAPINRDPSGLSLFNSVEKLGLSLEARNSPMPVLVVDHIMQIPTEN